jgi:hypothetical protein
MPGHGTLIKFCATSEAKKAKWKIGVIGAGTASSLNAPTAALGGYGVPVEIVNVKSRKRLSPYFRYLSLAPSLGLLGSGGGYPTTISSWSPGIGWGGVGLAVGQRPTTDLSLPQLAVQYAPVGVDKDFSDLLSTNYSEGSLLDQREILAFNIYSSYPINALPVLLSGQPAWEKSKDWWGNLDNVFAFYSFNNGYNGQQYVPWSFVAPAPSLTQYVTDYFDGAGQNGLTIISAKADQRYWCCFGQPVFDLNLITFNSQPY